MSQTMTTWMNQSYLTMLMRFVTSIRQEHLSCACQIKFMLTQEMTKKYCSFFASVWSITMVLLLSSLLTRNNGCCAFIKPSCAPKILITFEKSQDEQIFTMSILHLILATGPERGLLSGLNATPYKTMPTLNFREMK